MSKKRKLEQLMEKENSVALPQTLREVAQLPNSDLNNILRQFSLPVKGKRNHRVTLVANHLNISTSGGDLHENDVFLQTLDDVKNLKDGWTSDIRRVPELKLHLILRYLLASHDISPSSPHCAEFSEDSLKCYKALRSYDLWESGHISGLQFNNLVNVDGFCAVKCLANPSWDTSGTQYNVIVMLKESGEPVGATCTCVAGLGEACTHIAGLLFGIEDFVSRGFKGLPDAQATTEKLCKWIVPKGPKVEPKALREVSVEKNVPGRLKKEKQFRASDYNPLPEKLNSVNYDSLSLLHHTLSLESPNLPWVKAVAPAVVKQHKPQKMMVVPPAKPTLPDIVDEFHPELVPSQCLEVRTDTRPMTLIEKIHSLNCDRNGEEDILQKLKYKIDELMTIESLTRAQSDSVHWFRYRHGMITASNFQRVSSHVSVIKKRGTSEATQSLIDVLVTGGLFKGNAATRYGKKEEPKAIIAYKTFMKESHRNVNVSGCGLHVSHEAPFLGASPDGVLECDCHGKRLIEVKCPITLRSRTIDDMDFLERNCHGDLKLKGSGNTYYAQIQGQMGITNVHSTDLVIWDGKKIVTVPVEFDKTFWEGLVRDMCFFFENFVLPYIIKSNAEKTDKISDHNQIRNQVSALTCKYHCGKCTKLLKDNVTCDNESSINCECKCGCLKWFHWVCVGYKPSKVGQDADEPDWFCQDCSQLCGAAANK